MTIVETERVSAPDIERRDAREERARILEAAALEIEVRGWLQGKLCADDGRICMMGGIDAVLNHQSNLAVVMEVWSPQWPTMFEGWFLESSLLPLARFNDQEAKSAADVTSLLRWRASEIRDGR